MAARLAGSGVAEAVVSTGAIRVDNFDQMRLLGADVKTAVIISGNAQREFHRHTNRNGCAGGWVEGTASVANTAQIGRDVIIAGRARVSGTARVSGKVEVNEGAINDMYICTQHGLEAYLKSKAKLRGCWTPRNSS